MKLNGEFTFDAPQQLVWEALLDPVVLASIMPGCDKLEKNGDTYEGVLKIKVGPVQGKFNGRVELRDIAAPTSYRMSVDGKGQQGFVKADAGVRLVTVDGDRTHMTYDADANVGGKIASVGQRLIDTTAKAIIKQSLEGLNETIMARKAGGEMSAPLKARSQTAMAASIAADVGKELVPAPLRYAAVVLVVVGVAAAIVTAMT